MKKVLILGLVLAMLAILAVPMAAFASDTTLVSGSVDGSSIGISAPGAISTWDPSTTGWFMGGWNTATGSAGSVTAVYGSSLYTGWAVACSGPTHMADTVRDLDYPLLVGPDGSTWYAADSGTYTFQGVSVVGTSTYIGTGTSGSLPLHVAQYVDNNDANAGYGSYTATLTFTAYLTP